MDHKAIVIGVSSGGMNALKELLPAFPANFGMPVIIVQHISAQSDGGWVDLMRGSCSLEVKEAEEKELMRKGTVYFAPANYHLLLERDGTFSLTIDERVNFARPSIDVLFESAAEACGDRLIGVVLTGANHDGAKGLQKIKAHGGITIVQDPATAEMPQMPQAAIHAGPPDHVLPLREIAVLLNELDHSFNSYT